MLVSDAATLDVSFEVALARLAALTGSGALTQVSADACAALFQLVGVYRVGPGEDGHRTVAVPSAAFWTGSPRRSPSRVPPPARTARDPGPGRGGSSALARGTRGPRQ
jgi:hypothetical protein